MNDPYLFEGSTVLRNLLDIYDEKELDFAEAELSRANMMMMYDSGFSDFSTKSREDFAKHLAHTFPALWQAHCFREGNTRTIVMLMTFFVEHHGFYFDQDLLAASAGYVRNSFVMASLGENSEFEHLEKILIDAISDEPIPQVDDLDAPVATERSAKYEKYKTENYEPTAHEYRAD